MFSSFAGDESFLDFPSSEEEMNNHNNNMNNHIINIKNINNNLKLPIPFNANNNLYNNNNLNLTREELSLANTRPGDNNNNNFEPQLALTVFNKKNNNNIINTTEPINRTSNINDNNNNNNNLSLIPKDNNLSLIPKDIKYMNNIPLQEKNKQEQDDEQEVEEEDSSSSKALTKAEENYLDITAYLVLPQREAAKRLHMPPSTLSKRWRTATNKRKWPWRTVAKIDKEIQTLLLNVDNEKELDGSVAKRLSHLLANREKELRPAKIRIC